MEVDREDEGFRKRSCGRQAKNSELLRGSRDVRADSKLTKHAAERRVQRGITTNQLNDGSCNFLKRIEIDGRVITVYRLTERPGDRLKGLGVFGVPCVSIDVNRKQRLIFLENRAYRGIFQQFYHVVCCFYQNQVHISSSEEDGVKCVATAALAFKLFLESGNLPLLSTSTEVFSGSKENVKPSVAELTISTASRITTAEEVCDDWDSDYLPSFEPQLR